MKIIFTIITALLALSLHGTALPIKSRLEDTSPVSLVVGTVFTVEADGVYYTMTVTSYAGPGSGAPSDQVRAEAASSIEVAARNAAGTRETELGTEYTDTNRVQWDTTYIATPNEFVSDVRPDHLYILTAHAYTLLSRHEHNAAHLVFSIATGPAGNRDILGHLGLQHFQT